MTNLARVVKVMNQRGYLVFWTDGQFQPGEIVANLRDDLDTPVEGLTGHPFHVLAETDSTDFEEQARAGGWSTIPLLGCRYYRCTTD